MSCSAVPILSDETASGTAAVTKPDLTTVASGDSLLLPPESPVKVIFIHHSTGENWLADDNGGLGIALRDNNYFVSDTNYDWGPDAIGSSTDIGNWWTWFRSTRSPEYLAALFNESGDHSSGRYSRLADDPGGQNQIVIFKSCFPNSALQGSPSDPVPSIGDNPLKGNDCSSEYHTVANAKGIYIDLLEYFGTKPDTLFVVIAAPPLSDGTYAANARAFNQWLATEWLSGYPGENVFVFDFYNVLTTNGGSPEVSDLNATAGNHHRWWNGAVQHQVDLSFNTSAYPSSEWDDHPAQAGNLKATAEFVPLLNYAYNRWTNVTGNQTDLRANFTANVTAGTAPLAVQFTDTSTGSPTGWAWDCNNDGIVDNTTANPIHTYTTTGSYTVNLTVSNAAGSNTTTWPDRIIVRPARPPGALSPVTLVTNDIPTDCENTVAQLLRDHGYVVTSVPKSSAGFSTLVTQENVVFAEDLGMGTDISLLLENGTNVVLLNNAGKMVGTHWGTISGHILYVNNNSTFLSEYNLRSMVTAEGSGGSHIRTHDHITPANWQGIGCDWDYGGGGGDDLFTTLVYTGPGTGRGVIYTYDPAFYQEEGTVVFERALRYITGSNPQESFPSGRVAFLAANYTSSTTLTAREQAAIGQLTDKGYAVTVVPNYNRSFTDFSAACFVTQAEYFGFPQTSPYEKILNQTHLLLLGDAGKMVGTHWGTISGHILYVNNNSTFLSEYNLRSMVTAEGSGGSHIRTSDHITPANWQGIGCDWDYGSGGGDDSFTTLVYTGPGTGRGVIYTYDPAFYMGEGTVVFERALRYLNDANPQERFPAGNVALLAGNYTSGTSLTAREQVVRDLIEAEGFNVTVVPNYNRTFTDFSAARFVTQAEYFGFLQTSPYEKILNQTRLLLLGDSGKMVGTHWGTMSGHILYVNNNSAFLSEYTLRSMVTVEGSGGSHIRTSDHVTPANWQGIGCDWDYGSGGGDDSFTCLVYAGPGTGRGAIVTYDPDSLTAEDGKQLLHSAVEYTAANQAPAQKPAAAFSADPTSGTAPLAVQFTDLSTGSPTAWNWTFGDGATSTEVHPTHEYTADGNYTVSLIVSNAFGSDTATVADYIRVSSAPPTVTGIEKDYETAGSRDPTVRIVRGTGFTGTPEVALVNGSTTIAVANVTVVSPTKLTCTLDLATAPAQKYDVRVTTAGGTGLLRGGFTVFTVPPAMFRADHYRTGAYPDTGADIPNSTRWTFMTGISALSSSPCVSDGVVYVGSYDGNIYAIDAANGAKKWNVTTESEVWSSPCVSDGIVYFGSYGGRFYALDAATGTGKWSSMAVGQNEHSSPCISDGIVCVGGMDGRVHALDAATGEEKWAYTTGGSIQSSPSISDGIIYIGSDDRSLYAIDAVTGTEKWAYTTGGEVGSSPCVSDGVVYVGSYDRNIYAIDAATGMKRWNVTTGGGIGSSPCVSNGVVYVGSDDGAIYALDTATGELQWTFPTGSYVLSSPCISDGIVYVGSYDNKLYAIDAGMGTQKWAYLTDAEVRSSPCVSDGVVYVGSGDGKVHAIGTRIAPTAVFTANATSGPAPFAVQFTDTSTGNPTTWNWTFGDGATSTEQHPVHTYTAAGTYTVNLTVSTGDGSDTLSRPGYITATVKGDFNGNGIVDVGDVSKVAYMVVGKAAADLAADFNANDAVDIGDAAKIAYYFVGKIPAL